MRRSPGKKGYEGRAPVLYGPGRSSGRLVHVPTSRASRRLCGEEGGFSTRYLSSFYLEDVTDVGPMTRSERGVLILNYTHLNAGDRLSVPAGKKWESVAGDAMTLAWLHDSIGRFKARPSLRENLGET